MSKKIPKNQAKDKIKEFFEKKRLDSKGVKKIKRLAMKHHIRLRENKKRFCKKCYSDLGNGKVRITKSYKSVECDKCGWKNRWKIKTS